MIRPPSPQDSRPIKPGNQDPQPPVDGSTMPATLGSRRRAREALQAARRPRAGKGGLPPDVTFWVIASGIGTFLVLLLVAIVLYTLSVVSKFSTPPTAVAAIAPTEAGAPAQVPSSSPLVAATPLPPAASPTPIIYTVQPGDGLGRIAELYGVSVDAILAANPGNPTIRGRNDIVAGGTIVIPASGTLPLEATPIAPPETAPPTSPAQSTQSAPAVISPTVAWTPNASLPRSILDGDLAANYRLTLSGQRVTIHYQPGSFTDVNGPQLIEDYAEQTLAFIEQTLQVQYTGSLDVYFAGSLFAAPDQALRGRAFSSKRQLFLLYDGSGTPAERRYMLAHEMTHVVAWHTFGPPSSVMLSEGLATYVGQAFLEPGGFISYRDFCRALSIAQRLPQLTTIEKSSQDFLGHIRSLYNYNISACFAGYLFDLKGAQIFANLYPTSSYTANYGAGLGQLQSDFERELAASASPIAFEPSRLVQLYDEVRAGYDALFENPNPDPEAYGVLDQARIAVVTGKFDQARALLDRFHQLVK